MSPLFSGSQQRSESDQLRYLLSCLGDGIIDSSLYFVSVNQAKWSVSGRGVANSITSIKDVANSIISIRGVANSIFSIRGDTVTCSISSDEFKFI